MRYSNETWAWLVAPLVLAPALAMAAPAPAVAVPAWSNLFNRTSGWTGADGIFTHLADGWDQPDDPNPAARVLFVFSDTFIGKVDAAGQRESGVVMPRNTGAVLDGRLPRPKQISFFWGNMGGSAQSVIVPDTPLTRQGQWYWPEDGVVTQGRFYFFAQRMEQTSSGGGFNFAVAGVDLISELASGYGNAANPITQADTPLTIPATSTAGLIQYGNAVMANTTEAGAPFPDGYVYVYGLRNDPATKYLLAARVPVGEISVFSAYRFWNGARWVADIHQAVPITEGLSSEFSVTPLSNHEYLLVYQLDTLSDRTVIRYGRSPVGPWSNASTIYHCPEPYEYVGDQVYCYNAKAHPVLSRPGQILISYNVNTMSSTANIDVASIYHPRFIAYALPAGVTLGRPGPVP